MRTASRFLCLSYLARCRDEMRLSDYGEGPGPQPGYLEKAAALGLGTTEYELVTLEI